MSQELRHCHELRRLGPAHINRVTETVCGDRSFKKIFILLLIVDKLSYIESFITENLADDDLPLCKVSRPRSNLFGLARRQSPREELHCFKFWGSASVKLFEEWQWTTLAPTFEKGQHRNVKHVLLGPHQPLPFMKDSRLDPDFRITQGGHSTVFKVEIHPDHHDFNKFGVSQPMMLPNLVS